MNGDKEEREIGLELVRWDYRKRPDTEDGGYFK